MEIIDFGKNRHLYFLNTKTLDVFSKTYSNYIVGYNLVERQEEEIYE